MKIFTTTRVNIACWQYVLDGVFGNFEREAAKAASVGSPWRDLNSITVFDLLDCDKRSRPGLYCKKLIET